LGEQHGPRPLRVAVLDHRFADLDIEREVLASVDATVIDTRGLSGQPLVEACADADGILIGARLRLDGPLLDQLRHCRVIVRYGVGVDNVDVAAASARGITVANVPDYCVEEVATHAIAMVLALNRRLIALDRTVRQGRWELGPGAGMRRLSECTLGLIGFGRIGEALGRRAVALGMRVVAADPARPPEQIEAAGAVPVSLDSLLRESDFVSIHAPKIGADPILGAAEIATMRSHACVINVARGGLVDEGALAEALRDGRLAGAGVDVIDPEPPSLDASLLSAPNVILTPHSAWYSTSAATDLRRKAAEEVARVLSGRAALHAVGA
jgi:D-3-phosphoglycerate dehydrogenase